MLSKDDFEDSFLLIHTLHTIIFYAILWRNKSNPWSLCSFLKQNQKNRAIMKFFSVLFQITICIFLPLKIQQSRWGKKSFLDSLVIILNCTWIILLVPRLLKSEIKRSHIKQPPPQPQLTDVGMERSLDIFVPHFSLKW